MPPSHKARARRTRPGVIRLDIKGKAELLAAYIRLFREGGIFIPSTDAYQLGEEIYVLLTLPDETERYPVAGKVAWINPARASGNRPQGVGIRFPDNPAAEQLKTRIETALGSALGSNVATCTI